MKSYRMFGNLERISRRAALLLSAAVLVASVQAPCAAANLVLWDTGSPLGDTLTLDQRNGWKAVPSDLLTLEADPPKASSDPGYYGRPYAFKGDAVVENRALTAVLWSDNGEVLLFAKPTLGSADGTDPGKTGRKVAGIAPLQATGSGAKITRCEIVRNADDEVALKVFFSGEGFSDASAVLVFDKSGIVEIRPAKSLAGMTIVSPLEFGVVPGFIGDDLIYGPASDASDKTLRIPAEGAFLGLVQGEESELMLTWPQGRQEVKLQMDDPADGTRLIRSIDFHNDGKSFYLAAWNAPGIWHRETLKPAWLGKDIAIDWIRPFPAKWQTQLEEAGVRTTFAFRNAKGHVWRGVPGSYDYPVWFDDEKALLHLSKKVPPKGEALIYCLEGQETPRTIATPVDVIKATLGRTAADDILDLEGRKLRTHHRRGGDGVRRACTCGCTEAIQAVFEAGQEVEKKDYVAAALEDMVYFVERHVERIGEYCRFADDMLRLLRAKATANPGLKPFLEELEQIAQQIPQEYEVQKENMRSLEYAGELTRQTLALTSKKDASNLKAYMDLLKAWRAMGGAQDYVLAQCHTITRKLCQEAGYGCAGRAEAVPVAEEIRARCRQVLRNPDGYEIWANY